MIKPNELRIGNYFHPTSSANGVRIPITTIWHRVGSLNKFGEIEVIEPSRIETLVFSSNEIEPISLAPEVLEKCGFVNIRSVHWCVPNSEPSISFEVCLWSDHVSYTKNNNHHAEIKYLHQLQNLYFALNCKELSVNISEAIPA